jgi:hypothetical protein
MEAMLMGNVWLAPMVQSTLCTLESQPLSTPLPVHMTATLDTQKRKSTISAALLAIMDITALVAPKATLVPVLHVQIDLTKKHWGI